jgi:hypothetical protein
VDSAVSPLVSSVPGSPGALETQAALGHLKATLHADSLEFCREIAFRLPAALESASSSEIRQHFGPFLEHTFRRWAERENEEVRVALEAISRRVLGSAAAGDDGERESSPGPDSRLLRPALEVSTFAVDASVVASLAIGIGALFANVVVGGLFLLAAPTLATFGRERGERALRRRAAESAMKAVEDAVRDLGKELERAIDDFGHRIAPSSPTL